MHSFEVARELAARGALARLMTTHPSFLVARHGVPKEKIQYHPWIEVARRAWGRAPKFLAEQWNAQYFFNRTFDRWAAARLKTDAQVHLAWSGYSLHTLRRAKELRIVAAVDRGSSHIVTQHRLLEEEYARHGLKFDFTHPKVIEQEVAEYAEADVIHLPSLFAMRSFREQGVPEAKLFHLPYGFEAGTFKNTAPKDKEFRVVYAGNISLQKGFIYLLDAFDQLRLPKAELWVFGALSPEMTEAKLKLDRPNVKYFGRQPWNVLAEHFSRASVFCLPSVQDGFAIVLLQAMACGLPAIGTENSGAPDAVRPGKEGFVVPIRSVDALKDSIRWCYENRSACDEMGLSAQARVRELFTWKKYAESFLAYYAARATGSALPAARNN